MASAAIESGVSLVTSPSKEAKCDLSTTDADVVSMLGMACTQIYVETGGALKYLPLNNDSGSPMTKTVGDKSYHTLRVKTIYKTGTTATGIFVSAP